jgi:TldD protein
MMRSGEDRSEGDIRLPPPSVAYRIFPDGREELVRGATFKAISFLALKDIVAMGDSPSLLNTTSQSQPVSVVAPAVLVGQLELKAPTEEFEKPPAIPRPSLEALAGHDSP